MSDEPKFCKDCKHFSGAGAVFGIAWPDACNQPPERELIHGRNIPADPRKMRAGSCGPEGNLWEEKAAPPPPAPPEPERMEAYWKASAEEHTALAPQPPRWWEFWK